MYDYIDMQAMQQRVENIDQHITHDKGDFFRTGVEVYVGSFPDVSGPDLVIDPNDEKGIEIFNSFCKQMAEHYKTLI